MKKSAFSFVFLIIWGVFFVAEAQRMPMRKNNRNFQPKTPEERAKILTNNLTKRLSLNGEQKEQIYQINLNTAREIDRLRKEAKAQRERGEKPEKGFYAKQVRELNQQRDQNISALLNNQQKVEYEKLKQERKEKMRKRMEKRRQMRKKLNKQDSGFLENDEDFEEMVLDEVEDEI
ncbi:V-type ATP synthase subunit I [Raineya orbicola]|nr:hypothetical protein [Raineya orbicola]